MSEERLRREIAALELLLEHGAWPTGIPLSTRELLVTTHNLERAIAELRRRAA